MRKYFFIIYSIIFGAIVMLICLKAKYKIVIRGYFTNEIITLFLLAMLPLIYLLFQKFLFQKERNIIKYIAYFPLGLMFGMLIPILNFFIVYMFAIPLLGFEKEKYLESEHFRIEKSSDIISSGGQAYFEVYQKGEYLDKIIDEFSDYYYNVENAKLIDNTTSYRIEYKINN